MNLNLTFEYYHLKSYILHTKLQKKIISPFFSTNVAFIKIN